MKASVGQVSPILLAKGIVAVLLLVWIAVSLSSVFWRLLPQPPLEQVSLSGSGAAFAPAGSASLPAVNIVDLKGVALFGEVGAKPEPVEQPAAEPVPEKLEKTSLNLELVGSFASDFPEKSYAIIANGRQQGLYKVDEDIEGLGGVKLTRVYPERVVLNNRGRQEVLYMYPEGKPISSGAVVSSELSSIESDDSAGDDDADNNANGALASLSPNERLEKISDVIRFSRKTQDGKMVGFRVLPGRNRAAFEQTGLQLNDVVTAIDGQLLDNLRTANQVYQEKRNATRASLTVLRGDQEVTVDVDLGSINVN